MKDFMPPIPRYVAPPEGPEDPLTKRFPLQLSGWHSKCRTHTVHDNNLGLRRLDPQKLWIHPEDAAARSIHDGDMVLVYNDRGQVRSLLRSRPGSQRCRHSFPGHLVYARRKRRRYTRLHQRTHLPETDSICKRERTAYEPGGSEKIITIYEKQELSAKYQFGQLLLLTECSINIICFIITVQDVRFLHLSQQTLFPTA